MRTTVSIRNFKRYGPEGQSITLRPITMHPALFEGLWRAVEDGTDATWNITTGTTSAAAMVKGLPRPRSPRLRALDTALR